MNTVTAFFDKLGFEILQHTYEHMFIVFYGLVIAVAIALPLGVALTRSPWPRLTNVVLNAVGVIQTIPSLAMIAIIMLILAMMNLTSIGLTPALIALVLYSLLPIVRNTYTGIQQVDRATVEVARGMGMTSWQILFRVELPLSLPILMAGIRIATVWTIGVACLCSFVGAGGLGDLIMIGMRSILPDYILAGTLPAALLAIVFDALLARAEHWLSPERERGRLGLGVHQRLGIIAIALVAVGIALPLVNPQKLFGAPARESGSVRLKVAFGGEFHNRPDGYKGLCKHYGFSFPDEPGQMDIGLMYRALADGAVDVISGFATDGRIPAYDLLVIEDDLQFFPPYFVAPLVRHDTLEAHPELRGVLNALAGRIPDEVAQRLNYEVDEKGRPARDVAREFLEAEGLIAPGDGPGGGQAGTIRIGCKAFTEQEILGEAMALLVECRTDLAVERRLHLEGTMICFGALTAGDLDLYPEYTGTGLVNILKEDVISDPRAAYARVKEAFEEKYGLDWLEPFGLNNTYTLTMRKQQAAELGIRTVSDLAERVDPTFVRAPGQFLQLSTPESGAKPGTDASERVRERDVSVPAFADSRVETSNKNAAAEAAVDSAVQPDVPSVEQVADGLAYPEGPFWSVRDDCLYFVEWEGDRVNVLRDGRVEALFELDKGDGPCGLVQDDTGNFWVCLYSSRKVVYTTPNGARLRTVDQCQGTPFKGPNDLVLDAHGGLYFTDSGDFGDDWTTGRPAGAVYYVPPSGEVVRVADALCYPNGVALSEDGQRLLVCEHRKNRILAYAINPGGTLGAHSVFHELDDDCALPPESCYELGPDGLLRGPRGHYWTAHYGGGKIVCLDVTGKLLRTFELPRGKRPTNLAFAPGGTRLYVTESDTGTLLALDIPRP